MMDQSDKSKAKSLRGFEKCRVIEIGLGDFVECAQWGPVNCAHAVPFGYRFLCMHPHVANILENTKKALQAEKV